MFRQVIRLRNKYNIPSPLIWLTFFICIAPSLLNLLGIDFGTHINFIDLSLLDKLPYNLQEQEIQKSMNGRFIHTILVCFSIPIAFLTVILAFVDYSVKKDVSTPIVGVALFCAGLLDIFHILVATNLVDLEGDQQSLSQFTWVISRTFHAVILILGTGIFLLMSQKDKDDSVENSDNFVFYISAIFVLLSFLTINILLSLKSVPNLYFPGRWIARPYDVFPILLYAISGIFIFPAFYRRYPSKFSQMLILSLVPSIFTQVHMSMSTFPLFDNHFNIAHVLQIVTYGIPFLGLSLNYLQTHRNELKVIKNLDDEVRERLLAEDLIKGIFNSSLNGIMAFRALRGKRGEIRDFSLLTYNSSSQDILTQTVSLREQMMLSSLVPEIFPEEFIASMVPVVEDQITFTKEQYVSYIKKWLYIAVVKFGDGLVVTFGDVSMRKRTEQDLIISEKLALTGRFSRTIAHEIRNPLTNITLSMGQLKNELEEKDESLDLYFDIVKRNCERINQLITELLNSTRPEDLNFIQYPVDRLLDETLALALDRIKLKEIQLEKTFRHHSNLIRVDPEKLKIALLNIIINAVEAMEPGVGLLEIETNQDQNYLHISIADNGIGISPENIEKLYEPFYTGKAKGTGLGLTSARNIINNHKGTINVESILKQGTEFVISLEIA